MTGTGEEDFIEAWFAWRDHHDPPACARLIVAAAVDQRSDAEELEEFLGHLMAAVRDVLGEEIPDPRSPD